MHEIESTARRSVAGKSMWKYVTKWTRPVCAVEASNTSYCPCRALVPGRRAVSVIFENDLPLFHLILLLYFSTKRLFFEMCLVRSTIAKLCSITINFNDLDFRECRSEKVISSFWRSLLVSFDLVIVALFSITWEIDVQIWFKKCS